MRRLLFTIALASAVLLSACAGISVTYKEAPAASASVSPVSESTQEASEPAAPSDVGTPAVSSEPVPAEISPATSTPAASPVNEQDGTSPEKGQEVSTANPGQSAAPTPESPKPSLAASPSMKPEISPSPSLEANSQPPLLTKMIKKVGLTFDDIGYSQLVLVAAEGSKADIYCYEKNASGYWILNETIGYIKGYVGRNGVTAEKREGDGCTPTGLYAFGFTFGNSPKPETGMTWRDVTPDSYWVDDPNSIYYNQWVEGKANADWTSAEHLSENPKSYAYAVVVEYNTVNTIAGNGSAIFLHCKTEPTSGCIAAPQSSILKILKWLDQGEEPGVLIVGKQ